MIVIVIYDALMCGDRYNTRHVALKLAYLGWDYQGFVVQEDTERTIEAALFDALLRTRLVESRYQPHFVVIPP